MNLLLAVVAATGGYLFGSISSARVVVRLAAAQPEVAPIAVEFPGSDIVFESDSVSASAVRFQLGARYDRIGGFIGEFTGRCCVILPARWIGTPPPIA